ncbi:transposase [Streptomyces sp. V4I8]
MRTGITWRDPPERHGPWHTLCARFRRSAWEGVFTNALQQSRAGQAGHAGQASRADDIGWVAHRTLTTARHVTDGLRFSVWTN